MADYYSILNKTISGLAKNTDEVRQAVYSKARTAIENQLRKMDPPPGEEAIVGQLQLLEEAILDIESEYSHQQIEDELDEIIELEEPMTVDEIEPAPDAAEPEEPVVAAPVEPPVATPSPAKPAEPEEPPSEPAVAPAKLQPVGSEEPKKRGKLGRILVWLLILGILGGGGYAAWANRGALQPMIASVLSGITGDEKPAEEPAQPAEDANESEEDGEAEKEPVRLNSEGEDEQAEDPNAAETELQPTEVPVVLDQPEEAAPEPEPTPEVEAVEEAGEGENDEAPVTEANPATLGEVAYLYEEGSAGAGASRSSASVSWSIVQVKPTEALPPEAVIVGNMVVPEKDLSVEINIKRNVDPALSASHIIEISFEVPPGFAGNGIDSIARFVMKPTEEARGEQLVAVPVKVSDGYFLIALDNLDQAIEVNQQLLLSSSWVDIPISYSTGKRALLTMEKGETGDEVFKQAFEDWKNR
ncbi:MAG: hypothetical protein AAF478_04995 [Pseudomonadota bacterium]